MSNKQKRFMLPEDEIPRYWYNIQADMRHKPMPPLNPATHQPLRAEDLYPIFAEELCRQELNQTDAWIEIPEPVREMYKYYRSTPLVRAYGLEKALGTPAHIYFKNESVSPMGSHKLNSALAQAYYCKQEGVTNVTTETGAGQWGAALAYAARLFGLEAAVYQVKISYEQKPYRRSIMQTYGAQVTPSPSMSTRAGTFETLADVVKEVGADAARFMFLSRKSDASLDFDLELVKQRSMDNPVYYVQYAHARICAVLRRAGERGISLPDHVTLADLAALDTPEDMALLRKAATLEDVIATAAQALAVHHISHYLQELAGMLHSYYAKHQVLLPDDTPRTIARLALLRGMGQVLRNALDILGVSAPETM